MWLAVFLEVSFPEEFFFKCYLGYFRCTKGNQSHYFSFDWRACLNGIWYSESGFRMYHGNTRENTAKNPIFRVKIPYTKEIGSTSLEILQIGSPLLVKSSCKWRKVLTEKEQLGCNNGLNLLKIAMKLVTIDQREKTRAWISQWFHCSKCKMRSRSCAFRL